jgi:small subunit ribosomal protein S7
MFEEDYSYNTLKKQFINVMMKGGKKSTAERILNQTFVYIQEQELNPREIFLLALNNAGPLVTTQPRKRGRNVTHVPIPLTGKKRLGVAIKWILLGANLRSDSSMALKLAHELIGLSKGHGKAIKMQSSLHQHVYNNRMHINYR